MLLPDEFTTTLRLTSVTTESPTASIEDCSAQWEAVSLVGDGPIGFDGGNGAGDGFVFAGRRTGAGSWEWVHPAGTGARFLEAVDGAREISSEEIERVRIAAGIPSIPGDIGPDDLPNEGGLDMSAISYEKGCYLGQEIIARIRSRGRTRRRLRRVEGPGPVPARGAPLWQGGHAAGEMRSAVSAGSGAGFGGMAMLNEGRCDAALPFSLGPEAAADLRIRT